MGVYIPGMKMPKSCCVCDFMKTNDDLSIEDRRYLYCDFPGIGEFVCDYEATHHPDCPLVPVPPHGDLIDRDALRRAHTEAEKGTYGGIYIVGDNRFMRRFEDAPTVIPAEEGSE